MSNLKILCLPPIANTLRDLDMRFTWVFKMFAQIFKILGDAWNLKLSFV